MRVYGVLRLLYQDGEEGRKRGRKKDAHVCWLVGWIPGLGFRVKVKVKVTVEVKGMHK